MSERDKVIEDGLQRILSEVDLLLIHMANLRSQATAPEPRDSMPVTSLDDIRITDVDREAVRTAVTKVICKMCLGKGMVTPRQLAEWVKR